MIVATMLYPNATQRRRHTVRVHAGGQADFEQPRQSRQTVNGHEAFFAAELVTQWATQKAALRWHGRFPVAADKDKS